MDTHEITGATKEWAGKAERTYGRVKDTTKDAASDAVDALTEQSSETSEKVAYDFQEAIRQHPLEAVGIGLAVGALVGAAVAYLLQD